MSFSDIRSDLRTGGFVLDMDSTSAVALVAPARRFDGWLAYSGAGNVQAATARRSLAKDVI